MNTEIVHTYNRKNKVAAMLAGNSDVACSAVYKAPGRLLLGCLPNEHLTLPYDENNKSIDL